MQQKFENLKSNISHFAEILSSEYSLKNVLKYNSSLPYINQSNKIFLSIIEYD